MYLEFVKGRHLHTCVMVFLKISAVHNYKTRGSTFDYHISKKDVPGGFSYFSKVQWNSLPVSLKTIDSEAVFRVKLKGFLMEGY